MAGNKLFSKTELSQLVAACSKLAALLLECDAALFVGYAAVERAVRGIEAVQCMLAYLYAEQYNYGKVTELIAPTGQLLGKYTMLASLVFTEPQAMVAYLTQLPASWQRVEDVFKSAGVDGGSDLATVHAAIEKIQNASARQSTSKPISKFKYNST